MYVCMCLKGSVNYGQTVEAFAFLHKTEWVNIVLGVLNLEEKLNCMIGSKVTTVIPPFLFKNIKRRHVGCLSRGDGLAYCAVHSDFILGVCI